MYRAHTMLPGEAYEEQQRYFRAHQARIHRQRMRNAAKSAIQHTLAAVGMAVLFICTIPFLLCI